MEELKLEDDIAYLIDKRNLKLDAFCKRINQLDSEEKINNSFKELMILQKQVEVADFSKKLFDFANKQTAGILKDFSNIDPEAEARFARYVDRLRQSISLQGR